MRIAFATCGELPLLDEETRALLAPLGARGVSAVAAVWDDPSVAWDGFDLVVVRSCWDYVGRRKEFLDWCVRVPRLANPASVIAWNTDKSYLRMLAAHGVPIAPTQWLKPTDAWQAPLAGDWVVKPAISIASLDTGRYDLSDANQRRLALAHAARLQGEGRTVMVQPYLAGVDADGETSLVFLGGVFSHAVRKAALLSGPDAGLDRRFLPIGGATVRLIEPSPAELATAREALKAASNGGEPLLYARVDLAPGPEAAPLLMELELTEPNLYLDLGRAHRRFVDAIAHAAGHAARAKPERLP